MELSYSTGQMQRSRRGAMRVYLVIFIAWTVLGLFFFTQALIQRHAVNDPTPWWRHLVAWITAVQICAALTPAILWAGRRYPLEKKNWIRWLPVHLLFAALFSVTAIAVHSFLLASLGLFPSIGGVSQTFTTLLLMSFHQNVTAYGTVLGLQCAFQYYGQYQESERQALQLELRAAELKTQLSNAQLHALKMQLQPHFLFNTLNAIVVLIRQNRGAAAEEMLARLSDLLRYVLDDVDAQEVCLRRELAYVKLYLDIERVRFHDRLRVEIDTEAETVDAAVPHMGLQPLVENAVQHGISRSSSAGLIRIGARRSGNSLLISVCDDGPGLRSSDSPGYGIGLSNTRARLQELYGSYSQLTLEDWKPHGVLVTMTLPFRRIDAPADNAVIGLHAADYVDR